MAQCSGNFDEGTFEISFDNETVIHLRLTELDQNHDNFQKLLMGQLNRAFERSYRIGYKKAKDDLLKKINQLK